MEGIKSLIFAAVESLKDVLAKHECSVSWSSGKDSSVVLGLVMQAAASLKRAGVPVRPITVMHGDTTVENPEIRAYADKEIRAIERYARALGIPLTVVVARPNLTESWQVRVIGGRALPAMPGLNHDCAWSMKVEPMKRARKVVLGDGARNIITVMGTRFEESPQRAARMRERGETPDKSWQGDDGNLYLSPIALWGTDDVWEYLGLARAGDSDVRTFSDFEDVFRIYSAGSGSSCAVVGDMAARGKSKPCGARTGCWCCTPAGRDKSLEAMIAGEERYGYMRGLNQLQRFLINTRWDFSRRLWLGRTLDDEGYVAIRPDVYSPDMLRELLRYCLTLDAEERSAAASLGIAPRFEIISLQTLIAIDAMWNLQGYHKAFEAMRVFKDVVLDGNRYPVPEIAEYPRPQVLPKTQWLYVGLDYKDDSRLIGLRDLALEMVAEEGFGCMGTRTTRDGRTVLDVNTAPAFEVDEEGAVLFMEFELDRVLLEQERGYLHQGPTDGYLYYSRMGILSLAPQAISTVDEILRRTWWKAQHGWFGQVDTEVLLRASVPVKQEELLRHRQAA